MNSSRFFLGIFLTSTFLINFLIVVKNNLGHSNVLEYVYLYSVIIFIIFFISVQNLCIFFKKKIKTNNSIDLLIYQTIVFLSIFSVASNLNPHVEELFQELDFNFFSIATLKTNLTINLFISLILLLIFNKFVAFKRFIPKFMLIFISTTFIYATYIILISDKGNQEFKKNINISDNLNVFIISLDSLSSIELNKFFEKKENTSQFKGFTYFNNVIGKSTGSASSLAFDIIGNIELKDHQKYQQYLDNIVIDDKESFLNSTNIHTETFGYYNYFKGQDRLIDFENSSLKHINDEFFEYFIPSLKRFFTNYFVDTFLFKLDTGNTSIKTSLSQYNQYLEKLKNANNLDKTVLHLGHWIFTHYPNIFNSDCSLNAYSEITHAPTQKRIQNEKLQFETTKCGFKKINEFINVLKYKNIYDNSLIVIKSDHGPPSNIYKDDKILSTSLNNSIFGYSRHLPFLIIKLPNQNNNFKNIDSLVMMSDLSKYICDYINQNDYDALIKCNNDINYIEKYISNQEFEIFRDEQIFIDKGDNRMSFDDNFLAQLTSINSENFESKILDLYKSNLDNLDSCFIIDFNDPRYSDFQVDYQKCLKFDDSKKNILFLGDGISNEIALQFYKNKFNSKFNGLYIFGSGCKARYWDKNYNDFDGNNCREMNKFATNFIHKNIKKIDHILWINESSSSIDFNNINLFDTKILVTGIFPHWNFDFRDYFKNNEINEKNIFLDKNEIIEDIIINEKKLKTNIKKFNNINLLSLIDLTCEDNKCIFKVPNTFNNIYALNPIGYELTEYGANYFLNKILKNLN